MHVAPTLWLDEDTKSWQGEVDVADEHSGES